MTQGQPSGSSPAFDGSLLFAGATRLHGLFLWVAPSEIIARVVRRLTGWSPERAERVVELYIITVTLALAALWLADAHQPAKWLALLGAVVAVWRGVEICTVALGLVVRSGSVIAGKSLIVVGIYAVQFPLILAITNEIFAGESGDWSRNRPHGAIDWLYLSATNIFTLGNSITPKSTAAKALVIASLAVGVLLLSVFVTFAIALYNRGDTPDTAPGS
jgi:hypothetical protein